MVCVLLFLQWIQYPWHLEYKTNHTDFLFLPMFQSGALRNEFFSSVSLLAQTDRKYYTCQLFLSQMHEIFISILPEFLKISDDFGTLLKMF